ncbi:MAG: hypothetical protein IKR37_01675, partial [Paludibacteraceae bacterium]|nr:hypothetical protein [Paludibacteraceae bacterium]
MHISEKSSTFAAEIIWNGANDNEIIIWNGAFHRSEIYEEIYHHLFREVPKEICRANSNAYCLAFRGSERGERHLVFANLYDSSALKRNIVFFPIQSGNPKR